MIVLYLSMLESEEDQQKFSQLYAVYEKKLYAVTLKILGNPTQAEDAVQQAWLKLLQNWGRVSTLSWDSICGYAVTTAKNAALDMLRVESRTMPIPDSWEPPARSENEDEYHYLVSLIQSLPELYRRILELKYIEEQSNREISMRLKISEATVATRARRGKMMLRKQLEEDGFYV